MASHGCLWPPLHGQTVGASVCRELLLIAHLFLVLWCVSNCVNPVGSVCGCLCPRHTVAWCLEDLGGVYLRTYLVQG